MATMLDAIRTRIDLIYGQGTCTCGTCAACRERWLLARVEEMEKAGKAVLALIENYRDCGFPNSCGACGTPNAACDGDCMSAGYIEQDLFAMRKALAALTAPMEEK